MHIVVIAHFSAPAAGFPCESGASGDLNKLVYREATHYMRRVARIFPASWRLKEIITLSPNISGEAK
jgi:hypothetical protein